MKLVFQIPDSSFKIDIVNKRIINGETIIPKQNVYTIQIGRETITKEFDWFFYIAVYSLKLPVLFNNKYSNFNFVDYKDVWFRKYEIDKIPIFKEPIEHKINGEMFRVIPRFPKYAISKTGKLVNVETGIFQKKIIGGNRDYTYYKIFDSALSSNSTHISVHRLLCYAWVHNDDYINKTMIDHIDGDKHNNTIENLQWVTPSENVKRAIYGHEKDVVFCRKVNDKVIKGFRSLNKCCDYIGRSKIITSITPLIKGRVWTGSNGNFYISTNKEELEKDLEKNKTKRKERTGIVEAYNIHTKEHLIFDNPTSLMRDLKLGTVAVLNRIYNGLDNVPLNGWIMRIKTNKKWDKKTKQKSNEPKKCIAVNREENEEIEFNSIKALGRFLKTTNNVINKHISSGKPFNRNGKNFIIKWSL